MLSSKVWFSIVVMIAFLFAGLSPALYQNRIPLLTSPQTAIILRPLSFQTVEQWCLEGKDTGYCGDQKRYSLEENQLVVVYNGPKEEETKTAPFFEVPAGFVAFVRDPNGNEILIEGPDVVYANCEYRFARTSSYYFLRRDTPVSKNKY